MARAVGKGSDSLLMPQTAATATGDRSLSLLCFSALPAPPWHAPALHCRVGGIASPWGAELPQKAPADHLLLGLAFGLGGLVFPA